jgi:hypothetical protein
MTLRFPAALVALTAATLAADDPIDVGDRSQLFIDGRFIARSEGITLRANQAQKLGPITDPQGRRIDGHVSRVLEDDGKIRLYLGAEGLKVYESDDGLRFTPAGDIPGDVLPTIFLDPHDPDPSRRYKLFGQRYGAKFNRDTDGVFARTSADGFHFAEAGRVLPYFTDNPAVVTWDDRLGKYVIYTRAFDYGSENQRRVGRIETDDPLKPWPVRPTPDDRERLSIENVPVVLQADEQDDPHSDIYYNAATDYPWAQDVHLMFAAPFRHFSPDRNPYIRPRPDGWEDYGFLEVQLAVSRDGVRWRRPTREPYFPTGLADEWDRWYAVMGPGLVRRGNYLYSYYVSTGRTHDSVILRPEYDHSVPGPGGVGVVRQRLDGFVSADADHKGGRLETPPVTFQGKRLRLNIDTGGMGTAFVELRDDAGNPIPGHTLADCEEIGGNFIDQTVYWKGDPDVSPLAGRPVRLCFKLTRAKLYSFRFSND